MSKFTVFPEGAGEVPTRPRPTNPVYNGTRLTLSYAVMCEAFRREPTWCPALPAATHPPRGWGGRTTPPPLQDQRCLPQGAGPLARAPGHPPAPPRRHGPRGPGAGPGDLPHPPLQGSARAPPPPSGASGAERGARLPANTGGHRCYRGPLSAAPPSVTRRPPGAQYTGLCPRRGAVAPRVGRVAHPPPAPVPMHDHRPLPARDQHHRRPPFPSPPPLRAALHGTAHDAPLMQ